ncbi:hypothetical protein BC629DRAFT_400017 [Irpex lacteus]|nr:hypothetical protein BC629DRAFT_400017 [Irpex lacteus]
MFASTSSDRRQPNLSITPFYINSSPAAQYSPWSSPELTVQYDHRGRLQPYVETSEQRRARLEFLRKREFSRRISAWLEDSSSKSEVRPSHLPLRATQSTSLTPFRPLSSQNSESDRDARSGSLKSSSSDTDSLHTIDEDEEAEGEVIYSTSPSVPPRWGASTTPNGNTMNGNRPRPLRASSRSSSFSSLSSISEEDAPCV